MSIHDYIGNPAVDWVALERFMAGHNPGRPLRHAEKVAAAQLMAENGDSFNAIAVALHIRTDQVRQFLHGAGAA